VQEQIKGLSKQTAQANLFLGAIASLVVPLPSKEEQDIISNLLDKLMIKAQQAKEIAEQVIDQIDTMKKSILARAFRGELGTNDPTEESAVELLKRVL
jgi:type I restriction enzyme S subunit